MKKKLKFGGVLDFTAEFGLKVSQVTAGFGYGLRRGVLYITAGYRAFSTFTLYQHPSNRETGTAMY